MFKSICMVVLLFSLSSVCPNSLLSSMRNFVTKVRQRFVGRTPKEELENIAALEGQYKMGAYEAFGIIKRAIEDKDFDCLQHWVYRYPSSMYDEDLRKRLSDSLKDEEALMWRGAIIDLFAHKFSELLVEENHDGSCFLEDISMLNRAYYFNKAISISGKRSGLGQREQIFGKVLFIMIRE